MISVFVPAGQLSLARQLIAGNRCHQTPVPAGRLNPLRSRSFKRPAGTRGRVLPFPAMNHWANVRRPYGTVSEILFLEFYICHWSLVICHSSLAIGWEESSPMERRYALSVGPSSSIIDLSCVTSASINKLRLCARRNQCLVS